MQAVERPSRRRAGFSIVGRIFALREKCVGGGAQRPAMVNGIQISGLNRRD